VADLKRSAKMKFQGDDSATVANPKEGKWVGVCLGLFFMLCGCIGMVTGRDGGRFGPQEGIHVRIGGALTLVVGLWWVIHTLRKLRKK
jgi:putative Mn2+ efflux pump MntP